MSELSPFQPQGPTALLAVNATSQTIAVKKYGTSKVPKFLQFVNLGGATVFVNMGMTPDVTAAIPIAGTPASGLPIQAGSTVIYETAGGHNADGAYVAAIAASAGPFSLYITPGEGT